MGKVNGVGKDEGWRMKKNSEKKENEEVEEEREWK